MSAIATGAAVILFGLKAEVYNSQEGICYGISENGRYIIELATKKRILVKRENIEVIPRSAFGSVYGFSPDSDTVKASLASPSSNASWAKGLNGLAAAEWFVDCYRMRIDDEYTWKGELRPGSLYDNDHTEDSIVADFLVYCHLAIFVGAVPLNWDWVQCLDKFGYLIRFAFEKSDAGDKYGRENIFSGLMGGRSLRFTAEIIYGSSAVGGDYNDPSDQVLATVRELERLYSLVSDGIEWSADNILFKDVGGFDVWNRLLANLD